MSEIKAQKEVDLVVSISDLKKLTKIIHYKLLNLFLLLMLKSSKPGLFKHHKQDLF
jgi:hypothetical protein